MMTSSYPQHPGGLPHPGMPHGQQMGPGPGPGQHLGQAMQMHPGVSGPNGPHVSQAGAMMPGMQQGAIPNAHALSHLTPQPHMFQQQQQQQMQAMNPALVQQQQNQAQQQAMFRQRQQQMAFQQQQQQQQQQNGIGMGFPAGMNPNMTAQLAAMQQGNPTGNMPFNRVDLPPHMQAQLQQQRQMAQQAQQAQQAAAQAQAQAQAQQQAQQQQHQQMQQHMAMQHAASQGSNPSQQGPQGPQTSQPQQGPLRPPSQMSGPEGHVSPAPPPNPQQSQPPQSQPPQAPNQPQNLQQQPSQQQHPPNPQQIQQRPPQQAFNQAAVQQAMIRRQQEVRQQQNQGQGGQTILKLLLFLDHLSRFSTAKQPNDVVQWTQFVTKFFSPDGEFKHTLFSNPEGKTKQFSISFAALPRYYYVQFDSGVENIQITIDGANEKTFGTDCNYVESQRAKIIYLFQNGTQLVCPGKLSAIYSQSNQQNEPKLDLLSFETQDHQQFIPRSVLERRFTQPSPMSQTQSPRMTNKPNAKQRNQQRQLQKPEVPPEPFLTLSDLPLAPVNGFGVTDKTQQYLEICETFSHMNQLILYAQDHPELTPAESLRNLLSSLPKQFPQQPNQGGMPPNQAQLLQQQQQQNLPPGSRTPSGTGQPGAPTHQFMSPAMANLGLPGAINGSPHLMGTNHTPSPAGTHGLVNQHSQQGTNSSATASANTSPNVSNKRRRSVKLETDDGGGGEVNGAGGGGPKVKASPRVGGNKRVKGNG